MEKRHFAARIRQGTIGRIRTVVAETQAADPMSRVVVGDVVDELLTEALDARDKGRS